MKENLFLTSNFKIGYISIKANFELLDFETKVKTTNKIKEVLVKEFIPLLNTPYFLSNLFSGLTQSLLKCSSFNEDEIQIIKTLSNFNFDTLNELSSLKIETSSKFFEFQFCISHFGNSEKFQIKLFNINFDKLELKLSYRFDLMQLIDDLSDEEMVCNHLARINKQLMFVF